MSDNLHQRRSGAADDFTQTFVFLLKSADMNGLGHQFGDGCHQGEFLIQIFDFDGHFIGRENPLHHEIIYNRHA